MTRGFLFSTFLMSAASSRGCHLSSGMACCWLGWEDMKEKESEKTTWGCLCSPWASVLLSCELERGEGGT